MKELRVLGILVSHRNKDAVKIQEVLTRYGCNIKTRLGLHDVTDNPCSPHGLIILELMGDVEECNRLENELLEIDNLQVKKMVFEH